MAKRTYGNFTRSEWQQKNAGRFGNNAASQTTTPAPDPTAPPETDLKGYFPNSPFYEQGWRNLNDQYRATLASLNAQRAQIQPAYNLGMARLGTNQGWDWRDLQSTLADRGIYNSGITTTTRNQLYTGYDRQRQDLAAQTQQQYGALTNAEAQARLAYFQGLQDLLLQAAQQMASDPSWALPYGTYSSTAGTVDWTKFFNPLA